MSDFLKTKLPIILFEKLGKKIGLSTTTGDFYDLSPDAFEAFQKLNLYLSQKENISDKLLKQQVLELNISKEFMELFPISHIKNPSYSDFETVANISDITLNITSECNLSCIYCWNDQGSYSNSEFKEGNSSILTKYNKNMTFEIARKSIDFLVSHCGNETDLVVDFYGGEPLKNIDVLNYTVNYCREIEKKTEKKFHFLLATNGTLLTPKVAKELISNGVQIAVSIDGPKSIHDKNRPFNDGNGSFDVIYDNLSNMPDEIKKRLVGRTTVTPFYPDMTALYKNLQNLGFERIEIFESEDACHKMTKEREKVFFSSEDDFLNLFEEYEKLALKYIDEVIDGKLDYKKTFFNRFFKLMQRLYYNHEVSGGCPAAKGQVAVSSNGDIYPCTSFLGIEGFSLGNVNIGLNRKVFEEFTDKIKNRFKVCYSCDYFSICKTTGSCLNINHYFNSDITIPHSKSCELFIEKLQLAMAALSILSDKIPNELETLFGNDPIGRRGNELY